MDSPEVPGYTVGPLLGRGGMGAVYRAREHATDRDVALKWIPFTISKAIRERFAREARATARARHPNIVTVFGAGEAPRGDFIAMELVEGTTLADALAARSLERDALVGIVVKVARALAVAHEAGIVHRDVKPSNILLDRSLEPRVADFGLARFAAEKSDITGPTAMIGTLSYMAPEVATGRAAEATPSADVFSLGCVLYECLAGRPPFEGASVQESLVKTTAGTIEPLPDTVPVEIVSACLGALRPDPAARPTAAALADELERALAPPPPAEAPDRVAPRSPRRRAVDATILALSLAVLIGTGYLVAARYRLPPAPAPSAPPGAAVASPSSSGAASGAASAAQGTQVASVESAARPGVFDPKKWNHFWNVFNPWVKSPERDPEGEAELVALAEELLPASEGVGRTQLLKALGRLHLRAGDRKAALARFDEALALQPTEMPKVTWEACGTALLLGDLSRAQTYALNGTAPAICSALIGVALRRPRHEEVINRFRDTGDQRGKIADQVIFEQIVRELLDQPKLVER